MVITGSGIFVEPGTDEEVQKRLEEFSEVTFQVKSEMGTELVVNLEAEDNQALELLCAKLKDEIPQIVEIAHMYVNFEEEIEKIQAGNFDRASLKKPKFSEPGN
jgi:nitrate reductase NapAB chaperone NapD